VEKVAVDAVSVDLVAPCFEESSLGMVICMSEVVVESVVVLCEWAIESESVGRSVSSFFVLEEVFFSGKVDEIEEVVVGAVSGDLVDLGLEESSSWRVVGLSLFVPCGEAMVVSSSESELLVSPGLASLFVPCEEAIVMSSSGSGSVGRSVTVFFVPGGVLFWGSVCFGFGKLFKRTTVSLILYPLLDLEETLKADELEETVVANESVRSRASSFLLSDFDFKMLEDSFFLLGKVVRVAVLGCGHESDSGSQSSTLSRSLRSPSLWLEVLSL
jgi:hypothetical protein